jgi:hypothetical protein
MIYGDQHDPRFFEFFCQNNMLQFFVNLFTTKSSREVKLQLLQTLSIMIENTRDQRSVYYFLSNNYVNEIINLRFDFSDEELLSYYISFMKTLSLLLNDGTICFFFNERTADFPLYVEAIKFFNHHDRMVRIAVRTITLNVYQVQNTELRVFLLNEQVVPYFRVVVWYIRELVSRLDVKFASASSSPSSTSWDLFDSEIVELLDYFYYFHDVFSLGALDLSVALSDHLLEHLVFPVLMESILPRGNRTEPACIHPYLSLYLLSQILHIFNYEPLVRSIAVLFTSAVVPSPLVSLLQRFVYDGVVVDNVADDSIFSQSEENSFLTAAERKSLVDDIHSSGLDDEPPAAARSNKYLQAVFYWLSSNDERLVANAATLLVTLLRSEVVDRESLQAVGLVPRVLIFNKTLMVRLFFYCLSSEVEAQVMILFLSVFHTKLRLMKLKRTISDTLSLLFVVAILLLLNLPPLDLILTISLTLFTVQNDLAPGKDDEFLADVESPVRLIARGDSRRERGRSIEKDKDKSKYCFDSVAVQLDVEQSPLFSRKNNGAEEEDDDEVIDRVPSLTALVDYPSPVATPDVDVDASELSASPENQAERCETDTADDGDPELQQAMFGMSHLEVEARRDSHSAPNSFHGSEEAVAFPPGDHVDNSHDQSQSRRSRRSNSQNDSMQSNENDNTNSNNNHSNQKHKNENESMHSPPSDPGNITVDGGDEFFSPNPIESGASASEGVEGIEGVEGVEEVEENRRSRSTTMVSPPVRGGDILAQRRSRVAMSRAKASRPRSYSDVGAACSPATANPPVTALRRPFASQIELDTGVRSMIELPEKSSTGGSDLVGGTPPAPHSRPGSAPHSEKGRSADLLPPSGASSPSSSTHHGNSNSNILAVPFPSGQSQQQHLRRLSTSSDPSSASAYGYCAYLVHKLLMVLVRMPSAAVATDMVVRLVLDLVDIDSGKDRSSLREGELELMRGAFQEIIASMREAYLHSHLGSIYLDIFEQEKKRPSLPSSLSKILSGIELLKSRPEARRVSLRHSGSGTSEVGDGGGGNQEVSVADGIRRDIQSYLSFRRLISRVDSQFNDQLPRMDALDFEVVWPGEKRTVPLPLSLKENRHFIAQDKVSALPCSWIFPLKNTGAPPQGVLLLDPHYLILAHPAGIVPDGVASADYVLSYVRPLRGLGYHWGSDDVTLHITTHAIVLRGEQIDDEVERVTLIFRDSSETNYANKKLRTAKEEIDFRRDAFVSILLDVANPFAGETAVQEKVRTVLATRR